MTLIALITGATGQIGKAITKQILETNKYKIIIGARNESLAQKTVQELIQQTNNQNISYKIVDTSSHESIRNLAKFWEGPLHLLINVASATSRTRKVTKDGIELQFATNVLGYYWMMEEFAPFLSSSSPARIVNIASSWASDVDLTDLQFERRRYDNVVCYKQSKALERMITTGFADILKDKGVTVNSCHPGCPSSNLASDLGFGGYDSPEESARTPVFLALDRSVANITGKYFDNCREVRSSYCENKNDIAVLMDYCSKFK